MLKKILIISLLLPIVFSAEGSVFVYGQLLCHGAPYANERVQISEKNYVLGDQKWSETLTNENGQFSMQSFGTDWFSVTPYVYVPNYCGSGLFEGKRCTTGGMQINVPSIMISPTHIPTLKFDVGTIELNSNAKSEHLGLGSIFGGALAITKECRNY